MLRNDTVPKSVKDTSPLLACSTAAEPASYSLSATARYNNGPVNAAMVTVHKYRLIAYKNKQTSKKYSLLYICNNLSFGDWIFGQFFSNNWDNIKLHVFVSVSPTLITCHSNQSSATICKIQL